MQLLTLHEWSKGILIGNLDPILSLTAPTDFDGSHTAYHVLLLFALDSLFADYTTDYSNGKFSSLDKSNENKQLAQNKIKHQKK